MTEKLFFPVKLLTHSLCKGLKDKEERPDKLTDEPK